MQNARHTPTQEPTESPTGQNILRRKRFRRAALAPIFARSKSEECFKPEESPAETLATQARILYANLVGVKH